MNNIYKNSINPLRKFGAYISTATVSFVVGAKLTFAAPTPGTGIQNPINVPTFPDFINAILNLIITIGIPIAAIFLIYAGFMFVTARGNETQLATAKKAFFGAIIGTAILVGAQVLSNVITQTINSLQ